MKTLFLIRHAKSDWGMLDDFDRTLTQRGKDDALLVAKKIADDLPHDLTIWTSSARRATLTAEIMTGHWKRTINEHRLDLYTFDWNRLVEVIKSANDSIENLCVFGHNEGITEFVNNFGDIYIDNVPTAGLVSITFDAARWQDITLGRIIRTLFPKTLR